MLDMKKIENIAKKIGKSTPKSVKNLGRSIEKKIFQTVQGQLSRLDMVSREEFDIQADVLSRAQEKLTQMEQKLAEIENKLKDEFTLSENGEKK